MICNLGLRTFEFSEKLQISIAVFTCTLLTKKKQIPTVADLHPKSKMYLDFSIKNMGNNFLDLIRLSCFSDDDDDDDDDDDGDGVILAPLT